MLLPFIAGVYTWSLHLDLAGIDIQSETGDQPYMVDAFDFDDLDLNDGWDPTHKEPQLPSPECRYSLPTRKLLVSLQLSRTCAHEARHDI